MRGRQLHTSLLTMGSQAGEAAASQPVFLEAACTGEPLPRCHSHSQHTFCHCGEQNKLKILGAPDRLGESSVPLQKDGKILPIAEFCQDHSTPATCRHTLLPPLPPPKSCGCLGQESLRASQKVRFRNTPRVWGGDTSCDPPKFHQVGSAVPRVGHGRERLLLARGSHCLQQAAKGKLAACTPLNEAVQQGKRD